MTPTRLAALDRVVLGVAGLVAVLVGAAALLAPAAFRAGAGIDLALNPDLANETRAAGGGVAAVGAVILFGAIARALALTGALVGALVFGAYGMSRLLSVAVDGRPGAGLILAAAVELALGAACGLVLLRLRTGPGH